MDRFLALLPLILKTDDGFKLNVNRITEIAITAIIAGAFSGWISVIRMQDKMDSVITNASRMEVKLDMVLTRQLRIGTALGNHLAESHPGRVMPDFWSEK